MHFKWNYEPPTSEQQTAAKELGEKIGMSPILADLLIQRGIKTESAAKRFFRPMLSELIDHGAQRAHHGVWRLRCRWMYGGSFGV